MMVQSIQIGPTQAKALLEKNARNRPLSKRAVSLLADAIRRGEWQPNGATIVVGSDGLLLDGQHRLSAVVEAGIPVPMLMVSDADPRSFMTIDIGGKGHRSNHDILSLRGEKNATHLQSTCNWIERYYSRRVTDRGTFRLTPQQTEAVLMRHPGVRDVVNGFRAQPYSKIVGASSIAVHYLTRLVDPPAADRFFHDLGVGAGLSAADPALIARNLLAASRANGGDGTENARRTFLMLVRAWNARRLGTPSTNASIRVSVTGDRRTGDIDIVGLPRIVPEAAE